MAVGSGLSGSVGIATETTFGVPVPVTRFVEVDSESVAPKKHPAQGAGLRQGGLYKRAARRINMAREAAGDLNFAPTTNGFGLWLQHMLGSFSTTPTSIGGGLYRQIHNTGSLQGKSFTTQIVRPDTTGVLAQQAFTYPGCKITDWELSVASGGDLKSKINIDAIDEATPSNGFASTTLSASTAAAATSLTAGASIPAGSYVVVDTGTNAEVVQTGTPTGTGPYVIPITTPGGLKVAHASGVYVGSATGLNYGAATALQTASFTAGTSLFSFLEGSLIVGGSTSVSGGIWTNTGGQVLGNIGDFSLTGKNPLNTSRWGMGSAVRSEQLENGFREVKATVGVDYTSRALVDSYTADIPLTLALSFVAPAIGATLSAYLPTTFLEDGSNPNLAGPEILKQKLALTALDDSVNGTMQMVYTSTDATV